VGMHFLLSQPENNVTVYKYRFLLHLAPTSTRQWTRCTRRATRQYTSLL